MWSSVFWLALSISALVETVLALAQWGWLNRIDRNVPPGLAPLLPEGYGWWRGVAYARERLRVHLGTLLTRYAGIALLVGGLGLARLSSLVEGVSPGSFVAGFTLGASLAVFFSLIELPWGLYETFGVETRFGFNRTPPGLYARDTLLQVSLSAGFSGFLAGGASFLVTRPSGFAWALAGIAVFDLALAFLFPNLVLPLFYRLRPLPEGELKARLESLFERTGFPASALLVADGSRRSSHGNAFFAGLGRLRRVILFDTLADHFPPEEAAAVVAHEIGHWKGRHVVTGLVLLFAVQSTFVLFAFLAWNEGGFPGAFGLASGSGTFVVMAFLFWGTLAGLFLQPFLSAGSRRREFEADSFAARLEGPSAMIGALSRLATDNLAWTPSEPWFSAWYASHPSVADRVLALRKIEAATSRGK
jgi:STE24 endopeptidase